MLRRWSPCFLVLPMLLMWHYITQWSSGTAPVLLMGRYTVPVVTWWSTATAMDLRECFLLPGVFYLALLPAFQGFPGPGSSISKLAGLHADLRKIAPPHLIVWITTIHKIFICGRFYSRVKAGWPRNIRLYGTLVLWNISFTETLFLKYSPPTGFELSSQQVKMLQASCHNR